MFSAGAVQASPQPDPVCADPSLKEALWAAAAFLPPDSDGQGQPAARTLNLPAMGEIPALRLTLYYDEPLSPWPDRLRLDLRPEGLAIEDARPFGGPNINVSGPSGPMAERTEAGREAAATALLTNLRRISDILEPSVPKITDLEWRTRAPGLEVAQARLAYGVRQGPLEIYLARLDPALFDFKPHHESDYPGRPEAALTGWAERLPEAQVLLNGGQYYPGRAYMGLLRRDGRDLADAPHKDWRGFLVSGPKPEAPAGAPAAAVIDLDTAQGPWLPEHYLNVMQSFMLLDRLGRVRVRNSQNLASRAAVAQDRSGRILFIMVPGAISLYDLAGVLKEPALRIRLALGLDGGFEAQLMFRRDGTPFIASGHFSISGKRSLYAPGYSAPLPSVIAAEPKAEAPAAAETAP